jgi:hypothetical protein
MDLLTQSKPWLQNHSTPISRIEERKVAEIVQDLLLEYSRVWWSCDRSFPVFQYTFSPRQQAENEARIEKLVTGLSHELKHIPQTPTARDEWQARLKPGIQDFARGAFHLEQNHFDFIESSGMIEAIQQFARMARQFDPTISPEDIYQAGRNVMTANLIQLLMDLPVEVTPSIFAYSMLYPYTDNYLDDPAISNDTKLAFNARFKQRLQGQQVLLTNPHEIIIGKLIAMIENHWDRQTHPHVYEGLLAIHAAQSHSLRLVVPGASPFELDVLGISFEKGGTSVLADGYLVCGNLTFDQARFLFGFGAFTQLMDDLEDIQTDFNEGRCSIFSQTLPHWPLDHLTNQFVHFGRAVLSNLLSFKSPAALPLQELTSRCIDPILIDTIGRASKFYNKSYILELERHIPYRISAIRKQREKLSHQKINLTKLMDTLLV